MSDNRHIMSEIKDNEIEKRYDDLDKIFKAIDNRSEKELILFLNKDNINQKNKKFHNYTPLLYACWKNITDFIEIILSYGADITITDDNKISALHYACKNNNLKIVKRLIKLKADINSIAYGNAIPLGISVINNNINIVSFLLDNNANINQRCDANNVTPLIGACVKGYVNMAKLLIDRGADISLKDDNNETALSKAIKYKHIDIVNLFPQSSFNTIQKKCSICRGISINNTLLYLDYECNICLEKVDRIFTYQCGHINCCQKCFLLNK